jgi:hypothetical protein
MPALVAGIHALNPLEIEDVDGRDKPAHDGGGTVSRTAMLPGVAGISLASRCMRHGLGAPVGTRGAGWPRRYWSNGSFWKPQTKPRPNVGKGYVSGVLNPGWGERP